MEYVKAQEVLPEVLIEEIQKYVKGQYLYIPAEQGTRKKWGEKSGTRAYIKQRNEEIKQKYQAGYTLCELAEAYYLSMASIKKIIYANKA